jgi:hypothetical protein
MELKTREEEKEWANLLLRLSQFTSEFVVVKHLLPAMAGIIKLLGKTES